MVARIMAHWFIAAFGIGMALYGLGGSPGIIDRPGHCIVGITLVMLALVAAGEDF